MALQLQQKTAATATAAPAAAATAAAAAASTGQPQGLPGKIFCSLLTWWKNVKCEPELTDPFNLLLNVKLRMLWNWNFFYWKEEHFYGS